MSTRKHQIRLWARGKKKEEESRDGSYIKALKGNFIAIVLLRPQFIYVRGEMMKRTFFKQQQNHFFMQILSNEVDAWGNPLDYFRWLLKNPSISRYCCTALCDNMCSGLGINDLVIFIGSPSRWHASFIYHQKCLSATCFFIHSARWTLLTVWTHQRRCFRFLLTNTQYC